MAGTLILCAGPIGNLSDAPPRLTEALRDADVIYAEDTRRARTLLDHLGVSTPVRSYFVGNEHARSDEMGDRLRDGAKVALLTDAGSPAIADPGVSAVRAAVDAGATVTGVPGPSAVTLGLGLSGLSADRFVFEGFLPRSGIDRAQRIAAIAAEERTTVIFCAPGRLSSDLADLARRLGDRRVVVCREMTKLHEEVWRGDLGTAASEWGRREVKGEVTVVIEGGAAIEPDLDAAVAAARSAIADGEPPSTAVRRIAIETGVSRRDLYEAVIGN
jgi:16S rRNA (cytidine1402-2'-O)-methyltransferase